MKKAHSANNTVKHRQQPTTTYPTSGVTADNRRLDLGGNFQGRCSVPGNWLTKKSLAVTFGT